MPVYEFEGVRPVVDAAAFVHPTAVVIGDVIIGPECYVGPGAALRGDIGRIILERGANVQDNCTVHSFPGKEVMIEENGHVGHGAIVHGCRVGRNALIGMNAVIMDEAVVGEEAFVAAMAFVKAATVIPERTLWAGCPAKQLKELSAEEITWKSQGTVVYQHLVKRSRETMREVEPLREVEENRPELPLIGYRPKHE